MGIRREEERGSDRDRETDGQFKSLIITDCRHRRSLTIRRSASPREGEEEKEVLRRHVQYTQESTYNPTCLGTQEGKPGKRVR